MNDNVMGVLGHLDELKRRMFRVAIVAVVFCAIGIAFYARIFDAFISTAERLILEADGVIAVQRLTEGWVVAAKLAITAGLSATLPYFLWELSMFFKPGLKPHERKYIYFLVPSAVVVFVAGAAFAWYVLIPRFA